MNTRCLYMTVVVGAGLLTAWGQSAALAQCEITSVVGNGVTAGDGFGWSSSVSGNYAVIGTDEPTSSTGAAYIYERDGLAWNEIGRLLPAVGLANNDEYGRSVAISGRVAVVGARKHDNNQTDQGAAYVFRRNDATGEWLFEKELTAGDGAAGDRFGHAVAIDGNWIVVGAPNDDDAGAGGNSGTAYVFHYDGSVWTEVRKIRASDQAVGDIFGDAVTINGDWIAVGATRDDDACPSDAGCNSGSAYMFFHDPTSTPNDWQQLDKVIAQNADGTPDGALGDNFGNAVSVSGDRAVVAAWGDGDAGSLSGSAYIYRLEGLNWVIEQKLTASDGASADFFGRFGSVSIRGDLALIGARGGDGPSANDRGAAYLYRRVGTTWSEIKKLTASDGLSSDVFGQSVSIGGDYATIGASGAAGKGRAYVFVVGIEADCNENGVQDDCEIIADPALDSDNTGVLDLCECSTDDNCVGALACISGTCNQSTSLCEFTVNADFCAIAGECLANAAINPANDCEWCDSATNDSGWSDRDSGSSCGDQSDSICDHPDSCDGAGICVTNPEPADTVCADDGNECTFDQCDGNGTCAHPSVPQFTLCTDDGNDCTENRCIAGSCFAFFRDLGDPCGDQLVNTECNPADTCDGQGFCQDNILQDGVLCTNDFLFCTGIEICQAGVCQHSGEPCTTPGLSCDDAAEARNGCSCDPVVAGACDDGVFCNGVEMCNANVCISPGDPCVAQGELCEEVGGRCVACLDVSDCPDDGNECTDTACIDGICEDVPVLDNTPCGSDFDGECTNPDTCQAGVCDANDEPLGTDCGDLSDTECDPADSCDGAGSCADNIPLDGTPCTDDGLFCTGPEICMLGDCIHEGNPCTAPGLICDATAEQNDSCSCDPAVEGACDDGNECTIDECIAGACNHEAVPNIPATTCTDNGNFCDGPESCLDGVCTPEGNPCQAGEVCDEINNICACDGDEDCADDGLFCNGAEVCSGVACISAGDPCLLTPTTPDCDETSDTCKCNPDDNTCDNGIFCDGAESCVNGACVDGAKCPSDCLSGQCCDEREKKCLECEVGADDACDDGDSCTVDRCPFGNCKHEILPECKDDDGDGVINAEDQCPETPEDAEFVDAIGCTCADKIDTDHDGVIDCDDNCANTPLGDNVDSAGCTLPDVIDNGNDNINDNGNDNVNDNAGGNDNTNGNDNGDNANDNTNGNTNDNAGPNDNDNGSGQPIPVDSGSSAPLCGLFGMINFVFLGLGLVAMRMTSRRYRKPAG